MIYDKKEGVKDILDLHSGRMKQGLGLGDEVIDDRLRFKEAEFNVIAGLSNVGKTYWNMYYFLALARKHDLKFLIYSSENEVWILKTFLIQFLLGFKIDKVPEKFVHQAINEIDNYFDFVKTDKMYNIDELLEIFDKSKANGYIIDPHNSLKIPGNVNRHDYDYESAGKIRLFCRKTKKTIFIIAHCVTEAIRRLHPKGHIMEGYAVPPSSGDIEGGGKWVNRCDNFLILHRYLNHESHWDQTHVHVKKVRTTQTGGSPTMLDKPIIFTKSIKENLLLGGKELIKPIYDAFKD